MAVRLGNITFDCAEPATVADFWAQALDRPVNPGGNEFFQSVGDTADGPLWLFLKVPEAKVAKNRMHIDLEADDAVAEVSRLVDLGATKVADKDEWGFTWTVMADVEGNEFCVAQTGQHSH